MIKLKYTPGPWQADIRLGCFAIYKDNEHKNCLSGQENNSIVYQNGRGERSSPDGYKQINDEQEANARLIAAAPEMLGCLIYVYDHIDKSFVKDYEPKIKMKQAIEKATGIKIEELLK